MNPLHAIVEKARTVRPSERVAQLVQLVMPQRVPTEANVGYSFSQLHIDVARNAIGDFNPFHDPVNWRRIQGNPFGGPIAMGFQLEMLLLEAAERQRASEERAAGKVSPQFRHARFSFNFADVVHAHQPVEVDIRPSRWRTGEGGSVSNRVSLRRRCPPWRAKRRRVVPGSREATRDTRRAEGAKGDPKGASERGVQSYGRPVCSSNELAMLWRNAG